MLAEVSKLAGEQGSQDLKQVWRGREEEAGGQEQKTLQQLRDRSQSPSPHLTTPHVAFISAPQG